VAFWSDAAILSRLGQHVPPQSLLDMMLRIPAKALPNIALPSFRLAHPRAVEVQRKA